MGGVLQRSRIGMLALGRAQPRLKRGVGARARIKHAGGGWDGRGGGGGHSREHLCACGTAGRGAGARGSSGLRDERRRGRRGSGGWRIIFIDRGQSTVTHINQNTGLHAAGQPIAKSLWCKTRPKLPKSLSRPARHYLLKKSDVEHPFFKLRRIHKRQGPPACGASFSGP